MFLLFPTTVDLESAEKAASTVTATKRKSNAIADQELSKKKKEQNKKETKKAATVKTLGFLWDKK